MKCRISANKIRHKEGYFPVSPADTQQDIRTRNVPRDGRTGRQDRAPASRKSPPAGQAENRLPASTTLVTAADWMMIYKYGGEKCGQETRQNRLLHAQTAVWRQRQRNAHPTRACGKKASLSSRGKEYGGLSQMALYYIGGLLKTTRGALCAICNPTTNSYKTIGPWV